MPPNSSDVEEDGLSLALEPDVESVAIVGALWQERLTPVGRHALRHGGLVEADPRSQMTQQPAREQMNGQVRRPRHDHPPAAVVVRGAARERGRLRRPGLDQRIADRLSRTVVDDARDADAATIRHRALVPRETEREERPDRLRRRRGHRPSIGVASTTMSNSYASAQLSCEASRRNRLTISSRSFGSRTELKIGSCGNSGSPGKYICVTSRSSNKRPITEKWMCA